MPDSIPVRMWRDHFRLNVSVGWKRDIDLTVTDFELWQDILDHWFYMKDGRKVKKLPAVRKLLDEYDYRVRENERLASNAIQQSSLRVRSEESLPKRRDWEMPALLERTKSNSGRIR